MRRVVRSSLIFGAALRSAPEPWGISGECRWFGSFRKFLMLSGIRSEELLWIAESKARVLDAWFSRWRFRFLVGKRLTVSDGSQGLLGAPFVVFVAA